MMPQPTSMIDEQYVLPDALVVSCVPLGAECLRGVPAITPYSTGVERDPVANAARSNDVRKHMAGHRFVSTWRAQRYCMGPARHTVMEALVSGGTQCQ